MRFSRWLILIAILSIVAYVGQSYIKRKQVLAKDTPTPPAPLETGIEGRASDWVYTQSDGEHPRVTVRAHSFRQIKAPSVMELEGVELQLFHKEGGQFDLVKSAKAQFDIAAKTLYSEGGVEISMGKGVGADSGGRVLKIRSSGVRFESDTGKAATDRMAAFEFDQGTGSAEGVDYDPQSRQLHLRGHVVMDWKGKTHDAKPMHIEAGEAFYREAEQDVKLLPWSKVTRDTLRVEGAESLVKMDKGVIKETSTKAARGVQQQPGRKVEFAADHLVMQFGEGAVIRTIHGENNGKLISTANATRTTVAGDTLDLDFDPAAKESTLLKAVATGKSMAEAQPLPQPGPLPETRILRSEVIRLKMRPGGREIEKMTTDGSATVDFLPNRAGQAKRNVKGDHMEFVYGAENRLQHFGANNAVTRTEHPDQPAAPAILTQSKEIGANFDPKTGNLAVLAQKGDFRYQEGLRQATANLATLDPATDLMTLDGAARAWDPTGSASADKLVMNQKTGDFTADGHVATTHVPENKGSSGSAMLSTAEVMQGRAQHMTSAQKNQKLHYEGNAVVWQGANRVEADRIDIDRAAQMFQAHGKVVSQFIDKAKGEPNAPKTGKAAPSIFTVVRAPDLDYSGDSRVAHYQGGATMVRPGLTVNGKELRAYLNDSDSDTSLDKALADGAVKIVSSADKRTRTGTSDHAEYYAGEQKVILETGDPLLVDSLKGQTRGKQLTWWANNDRLLVNGVEDRHVDSLLRKK